MGEIGVAAAKKVENWLSTRAMPFWLAHGVDRRHGGYVERFSLSGAPEDPGFKRCRVNARQLYVFSHASLMGFGEAAERAAAGHRFFVDKFHLGGGRWARRVSVSGEVVDAKQDLYDLAFVMFGLGWWAKASGDASAVRLARETLETARRDLRHPSGEGYLHEAGAGAPYQQNPHMHLMEAMLVLAELSGEAIFLEEAHALYRLARDRFVAGSGTLAEFFGDQWARPATVRIEPGHHYEWTWLLKRYRDAGGPKEAEELAQTLFGFANRSGVDSANGLIWDAVDATGAIVESDHRIWAQLEAIKACIAMNEIDGRDWETPAARLVEALLAHYLDPAHPGLWIDHLTKDLNPRAEFAPTSTFYHVCLSFSEVLRAAG